MRVLSLVVTFLLGLLASSALAQGQPAAQSQIAVAVVDVGHILKNHPTMKSEIEAIETEMKAADEKMKAKREEILQLMEKMRGMYEEGTPDWDREEKEIAEKDTEFRLEVVRMRKEFDKRRADVLYKVYSDIQNLVKYASDKMGIQVVVRVNGTREEDLDTSKPETVQMILSQEVLHFSPRVDLTDWVLNGLKQRLASSTGSNVK